MQTLSNANAPLARGAAAQKIFLLELCCNRLFMTDPNAVNTETTYLLGPEGGVNIGAHVEDLQALVSGVNFSADFQYRVIALYSNDRGGSWSPFQNPILGDTSAAGNKNSTPYTDRTDFGMLLRFGVVVSNDGTSTAVESGTLSITMAIKVWT